MTIGSSPRANTEGASGDSFSGERAPDAVWPTGRGRIWLAASIVLFAIVVVRWASVPAATRFRPPTSPLDNVAGLNDTTRLGWGFLWQAREVLPAGSTYTIVAGDAQTEMNVYMLSLAVLTECHGLPTSYYLEPTVESGAAARFVLAYGCSAAPTDATFVQALDGGCVWDRGAR